MTIPELQALRDEAVKNALYFSQKFGERSVQYSDAQKTVAFYDSQIAKAQTAASGSTPRSSYASFSKD
jgi:hypothetical protein